MTRRRARHEAGYSERTYADAARGGVRRCARDGGVGRGAGSGARRGHQQPAGSGSNSSSVIEIDGHPRPDPRNPPSVDHRLATPDDFAVMRLPISAGRAFHRGRTARGPPCRPRQRVDGAALLPGEDPVGRRLRIRDGAWITVVGVTGDMIQDWLNKRMRRRCNRRGGCQAPTDFMGIAVRTAGDPAPPPARPAGAAARVDRPSRGSDDDDAGAAAGNGRAACQYLAAIMTVFGRLRLIPGRRLLVCGDTPTWSAAAPRDRSSHRARSISRDVVRMTVPRRCGSR